MPAAPAGTPWLRRLARVVVAAVVGVLAAAAGASVASAHATLESSSPSPQSVLTSSPSEISLSFDEHVDLEPQSIRLVTADGDDIDIGDVHHRDSSDIVASVPQLADGTYVVAWRVISADSHPVSGAFTFSVNVQTATQPGLVEDLLAANHPSTAARVWQGVGRWMSYAGLALAVGGLIGLAACAPALLAERRSGRFLAAACALGVAGTAWMIAAQAQLQVGRWWSPDAWDAVVSTTAGRWWLIRLVAFAVAGAAATQVRRARADNLGGAAAVVVAAGLVVVVAAGGHAISGRWVPLGFAATVAHLLAMSVWAGGLVTLLVIPPERRLTAAVRFSPIALVCVVTLAATGVLNAWRQAGSIGALTGTGYGTWLYVKLGLIAVVLLVASQSRRVVRHVTSDAATGRRRLTRLVLTEITVMVLVLAATAGLTSSAPPRQVSTQPASATAVVGDRIGQVIVDPPRTGGATMHVYLTSTTGTLQQPTQITVTASLPSHQITDLDLTPQLNNAGPGHLTGGDVVFPIAGNWTVAVTARYSEFDSTTFTMSVTIR